MTTKVVFSEDALSDLREIAGYIAEENPGRARTFVREIRARCQTLSRFPNAHQLVARYEDHGVRRLVHGSYLVFYHVPHDRIVILRVLNGAMDFERILFPHTKGDA